MQKIAWATDLHLNFAKYDAWESFVESVCNSGAEALLVGGDISEADDFAWHLERLAAATELPIYFVLGNHDFYHGSMAGVRESSCELSRDQPLIQYLTSSDWVQLNTKIALVGDDCPADARCGNVDASPVLLNDFRLIDEFIGLAAPERNALMRWEGSQAAARIERKLSGAAQEAQTILLLTHVPPFREACWYEGRISDDDWAPFFVCQSVGDMLNRWCTANPTKNVVVLCGHTHGYGRSRMLCNLISLTSAAEYGKPELGGIFELSESAIASFLSQPFDIDCVV